MPTWAANVAELQVPNVNVTLTDDATNKPKGKFLSMWCIILLAQNCVGPVKSHYTQIPHLLAHLQLASYYHDCN